MSRRGRRDASSLGPRPAHSRLAVPTREHQSGGPPIHAAPTRSGQPQPGHRPPGTSNPIHHGDVRSCSPAAPHLTTPFHIRRSSGSATASATSPTTGCGCCSTAASGGRLTEPQDCEAAPHAWWRRAGKGSPLPLVAATAGRGHSECLWLGGLWRPAVQRLSNTQVPVKNLRPNSNKMFCLLMNETTFGPSVLLRTLELQFHAEPSSTAQLVRTKMIAKWGQRSRAT